MFICEVAAHILLIVIWFVQVLTLRIDTLTVCKDHVVSGSYGLLRVERRKIPRCKIQDVRVIRKGKDRFTHKTRKISIRIYY